MAAKLRWTAVWGGLFAAAALGCLPPAKPVVKEEGHTHHGPHGGHVVEIGKEDYHAEWTHDEDKGLVTVYFLDKDAKKPVAIPAEKIVIEVTTTAKDKSKTLQSYELLAVNRSEGEMPTASQFELADKGLLGSLELMAPGAVEARIVDVEIDGKKFSPSLAEDPHHHH